MLLESAKKFNKNLFTKSGGRKNLFTLKRHTIKEKIWNGINTRSIEEEGNMLIVNSPTATGDSEPH